MKQLKEVSEIIKRQESGLSFESLDDFFAYMHDGYNFIELMLKPLCFRKSPVRIPDAIEKNPRLKLFKDLISTYFLQIL